MRWRVGLVGVLVLALLVVGGLLAVHSPPVRSFALRYAIGVARERGIELNAERLDYNLFTRHVRLANVKVSAFGDGEPFFTAAEVTADASSRVLRGEVAFTDVSVRNGRVYIVRRRDGTNNLPRSSGTSDNEPPRLPIDRLQAPRLAVVYADEENDIALSFPAITVDLSSRGRIVLAEPAEVAVESTRTRIERLESALSFDGRDLRLSGLRIGLPEFSGQAEGTLSLIRREPAIELRVSGDAELTNAAKWWDQTDEAPQGSVHLTGIVQGPLDGLSADLQVSSDNVRWNRLDFRAVATQVRLDGAALDVRDAQLALAGGQVRGAGAVEWGSRIATFNATWRDVDVAQLLNALGPIPVTPSGRAAGEMTAAGPIGSLEQWGADVKAIISEVEARQGQLPIPGQAQLALADGAWRLAAEHVVGSIAPVDVSLVGRIRDNVAASPMSGTLRVSESELQTILKLLADSGVAEVRQDLVSGVLRATADVDGTIGRPVLHFDVESDRAVVAGQEIVEVEVRGRLEGSNLNISEFSAAQSPTDAPSAEGGRLRAAGQIDLESGFYTGSLTAGSWRLNATDDVPLAGLVDVEYEGRGSGRLAYGKGHLLGNLTASPDISLGVVEADVELSGERANVSLQAAEFTATAEASIRLTAPYDTTLRANAPMLDLARTLRDVDLPVAVDGTADVRIEAEGPLTEWREGRASLEVATLDGRVQTLPVVFRGPARLRYADGRAAVEQFEASIGKTQLSASGTLPISAAGPSTDDALLATLTGDLYDVAVTAAVAAAAARASNEPTLAAGRGPLTLLARVTGSIEAPSIAADLEVGPGMVQPRSDFAPVENLVVRAHVENGRVDLREFTGSYHGANVVATGQAPLALLTGEGSSPTDGDAVLRATAMGVTAAVLAPFVAADRIAQVGGSLDATLNLSTSSRDLDDAQGEVVIDRLELSIAELPIRQVTPTRIVARDGVARVDAWQWQSEGTSLTVEGQIRLRDQQASLGANGTVDARLLTPFLASGLTTAGRVDTRLAINGRLTEPTIDGEIRLADGEFRLRDPRVVASDVDAVVALADGAANVTSVSGTVNGGALSATGTVRYTPDLSARFSANVTGMAMDFPRGLRTEIDSSLELTSSASPEDGLPVSRLSGLITIKRGGYREPLALVTGLLANLQRSGTPSGSPPSPFLQRLTLDVRAMTEEDLVIDNNVAKAQLGADLNVINVAAAPALSGRAELREGGQLFLGRNTYVIQSGTIDFANPTMIEPVLGIEATTRVAGTEILVRITGPPNNLMTELTSPSDPNLGQADLTALLLTGQRMEQLGEAQAAEVGAQVLGNLAGDVLGFAGRAIGLDTLRVGGVETNTRDPADLASETDPTSRVTFGKSFGSKVDVTLSQSLRESNAQTWIVDYLPVRRIALRLVSDDDDLRSYEFRHDITLGGMPAPIRSGDVSQEVQPRVSAVSLDGPLVFTESQVRGELHLNEGDRFDFIRWQEDHDRLERFYHERRHLAARVTARRQETPSGVELTYAIDGGPETRIQVTGLSLSGRALQEIEAAWTRSVFEGFLVEEAEAIVRRELAARSNFQATVKVAVEGNETVRTLVIDVAPGPRYERVEIRLAGVDEPLRSDLQRAVGGGDNAARGVAEPQEFERTIADLLRSWGYQQASVTVGTPIYEANTVTVPVSIEPGPDFRLSSVSFEGVKSLPLADLQAEAGLTDGTVYRPDEVDAARTRVQAHYRREGFTVAAVEARQDVRASEGTVHVAFVVREGPRQVIQDIRITGNESVVESVVRRALRLQVGDPLRTADWLEARRRLFETGLFRRVDITVEPIDEPGEAAPVLLAVAMEEWPALRLRYGFQVAEERPEEDVNGRDLVPGVSGDLTRRTVFGQPITLGVAAQYERRGRLGRVFVSSPTLFGRGVRSSFTVEQSHEESRIATLVSNLTSAAWEQRARRGALSVSYGLRFERNRTFDTQPIDPNFPFDLTVHIGRLTGNIAWDTRDDPSDSTRGTFVSSNLEHATSRLGSDLLFLRSLTQAYHFRPVRRVVLASAVRYGALKPLGGQNLDSTFLLFFAGGARTVRGVAEDAAAGRNFFGDPIGGRGLLTLNHEVRFPIYRWLRGVTFLDAGNVFHDIRGVNLRDLVGSVGFGVRIVTPFALLRADYGRTLWNRPVADSGRWTVGIGPTF